MAKFNFACATGLEDQLGIQLPFYGYVRNLGSRNTRLNKTSKLNGTRLFEVEDFLSSLSERALVELRKFDAHSPKLEFGKHIGRTFFETNHFDRPELNRFLKIPGRKTLIIQRYENLTEFGGDEVNNFCRAAYLEFWPIIDLNDAHFPIKRSIMNDTHNLPQYLMQNQDKVRSRIIARMEQHHIPRGFGRFFG